MSVSKTTPTGGVSAVAGGWEAASRAQTRNEAAVGGVIGASRTGDLIVEISDLRLEISDLRLEISDLRLEISDLRLEISDLRLEVSDLRLEISDLRLEISDLRLEISDLRLEVSDLRLEVSDLRLEVSDLRLEVSDLRLEISDLRLEISDLRLEISDLRLEVSDLRFEISSRRCGAWVGSFVHLLGPFFHALAEGAFLLRLLAGFRFGLAGGGLCAGDRARAGGVVAGGGRGAAVDDRGVGGFVGEAVGVAGLGVEGVLALGALDLRAQGGLVDLLGEAALAALDLDGGHRRAFPVRSGARTAARTARRRRPHPTG
jgi:cell division protein FtsL